MMHPRISYKKVAVLTKEQALAMPDYFDDNGGETDGWLYICAAEDAPEGAKIMNGFLVEGYTGRYVQVNGQGGEFCGWSAEGYAYALDEETADGIAREEDIAVAEDEIVAVEAARGRLVDLGFTRAQVAFAFSDFSDWPEGDEHYQWLLTASKDEILNWIDAAMTEPELNEDKVFDRYANLANPRDLVNLSQEQIAQQLVELDDDLDEATARKYAQVILQVARRNIS